MGKFIAGRGVREPSSDLDFEQVRRVAITAMFADDTLMDVLVLKGGSALALVHRISRRFSFDLDFSLEGDVDNTDEFRSRIFRALRERFDAAGYVVFDERFEAVPPEGAVTLHPRWGGYVIEFKLLSRVLYEKLRHDPAAMSRSALALDSMHNRRFRIEISKFEFCSPKSETELDDLTIYVYPPVLIAVEKVRAICQQMKEYIPQTRKRPRAADFYDIHLISAESGVELAAAANHELFRNVFSAKVVPLSLLREIPREREFHREGWLEVVETLGMEPREFDFYFDFVVDEVSKLESLWNE